jgi:hypothetical protein
MRSRLRLNHCAALVALGILGVLVSPAAAGLAEWQSAVASGTPAGYTNLNITSPIVADIGMYSEATGGGISYEFIVNATNDGASSALMGTAQSPAAGDRAGLKWEQWNNTLHYGTTVFGVADFDSGVSNTPGVDTHVVFVNNGVDTLLYVNGSFAATIAGSSPTLSGMVGIGQVYASPAANFDALTGKIIGVAVYDAALSAAEIAAHARAYGIPEPGSLMLLLLAGSGLALRREDSARNGRLRVSRRRTPHLRQRSPAGECVVEGRARRLTG